MGILPIIEILSGELEHASAEIAGYKGWTTLIYCEFVRKTIRKHSHPADCRLKIQILNY